MNLVSLLALLACSTAPEAPRAAPSPVPAPAPPPAPAPAPGEAPEAAREAAEGAELPPTAVPESYAGIVGALKEKREAVKALIDAGNLKEVHPLAKQIMDLATALPGKAATMAPADKGTVALTCVDIKEKADAMHDAADEGNAAEAKSAFVAVSADIDAVAALAN